MGPTTVAAHTHIQHFCQLTRSEHKANPLLCVLRGSAEPAGHAALVSAGSIAAMAAAAGSAAVPAGTQLRLPGRINGSRDGGSTDRLLQQGRRP
jgi:hypothetical protein